MKPVQMYARTSTDDKQETTSQRFALMEWQAKDGCDGEYREEQLSGRSLDRPVLNKIREGIRQGEVKKVIVWKLSRLGRNAKEVLGFVDFATKHKCDVYSLTEELNFTSATGRFLVGILTMVDEFTSNIISENTKAGLRASKTPEHLRTGKRLQGYQWFTEKKLRAKNTIFTLHEQGIGIREIMRATSIDRNTIRKMIRLPRHLVMGKKEVEALAKAVREGKATNPFPAFKNRSKTTVGEANGIPA